MSLEDFEVKVTGPAPKGPGPVPLSSLDERAVFMSAASPVIGDDFIPRDQFGTPLSTTQVLDELLGRRVHLGISSRAPPWHDRPMDLKVEVFHGINSLAVLNVVQRRDTQFGFELMSDTWIPTITGVIDRLRIFDTLAGGYRSVVDISPSIYVQLGVSLNFKFQGSRS